MTTCLLLSSFINIYKPLYVCVKRVKLLKLRNLFCLSEGRRKFLGILHIWYGLLLSNNSHSCKYAYISYNSIVHTHTHTYSHRQEEVVDNAVRVAIVVVVLDPDPEREEEIDVAVEDLDHEVGREGEVDLDQERDREEEEEDSRRI